MALTRARRVVIRAMSGFDVPLTINPFWYGNVQADKSAYRPFLQGWRVDRRFSQAFEGVAAESTSTGQALVVRAAAASGRRSADPAGRVPRA